MSDHGIAERWETVRRERRAALIPYLTAGFPTPGDSLDALQAVAAAGADFLEIGIPFSDPLADGPVIQRASQIALERGMTVDATLRLVRDAQLDCPVIAFSYLNPILAYGLDQFVDHAIDAGIAGVLVTDLPAGEDVETERRLRRRGADLIRLVAPTTPDARLRSLADAASGFIYAISRLGVTGAPTRLGEPTAQLVSRIRRVTTLPVAVGFGLATAQQAREVAGIADGVVVGSALLRALERGLEAARELMAELRGAVAEPVIPARVQR